MRIAAITGLPEQDIIRNWPGCTERDGRALIKIADGINRNRNGGQNVRAICALPALIWTVRHPRRRLGVQHQRLRGMGR